jgi:hypothetical protein
MPPTTTGTTVKFYGAGSQTPSPVAELSLTDNRSKVFAYVNVLDQAKHSAVQCIVDSAIRTNTATVKVLTLHPGSNEIGPNQFSFEDGKSYSLKFVSIEKENGDLITSYGKCSYGSQTKDQNTAAYRFDYIPTGSESFQSATILEADQVSLDSTVTLNLHMSLREKKPHSMIINVDQEDAGGADDNSEPTKLSSVQTYSEDNEYMINAADLGYGSFAVSATALFDDGHTVSVGLPEVIQVLPQFKIATVTPYGVNNGTDGGDPTIANILDFTIDSNNIVVPQLIDSNKKIDIEFMQGDTVFYTAAIDASDFDIVGGGYKYEVIRDDLNQVYTDTPPAKRQDEKFEYDVKFTIQYKSNVVGIPSLERSDTKSNLVFSNDYVPVTSVTIMNAWNAAAVTTVAGQKVIDLNNSISQTGYSAAPDIALVGSFSKTAYFKSGIASGFQKDLDSDSTKFKLTITVKNKSGTLTTPIVKKVKWHSSASTVNLQADVISLFSKAVETSEDGVFNNLPGDPVMYFMVDAAGMYDNGDEVAVAVEIIAPPGSVRIPSTQSNFHIAVTKPRRYTAFVNTDSEPKFVNGILTIPTDHAYDAYLEYITVTSNLFATNSLMTVSSNGGKRDIIITPQLYERGLDYMTYKVSYLYKDNGVSVQGPESLPYTISLFNPPAANNINVTNTSYKTINDDGKSEAQFTVTFVDSADRSADGAKVYFKPDGQEKILVGRINRYAGGNSQTQTILLNNGSSDTKTADGIAIIGVSESNNVEYTSGVVWKNATSFNSGVLSVVPYCYARVTATFDSFDKELTADGVEKTFTIYNVPVLNGNLGYKLVGGVKQSYNGTRVTWDQAAEPAITSYKATVTKHEYSKKISTVYKPDPASYPSATAPPEALSGKKGFYYNRAVAGAKHTWYLPFAAGLKAGDIKNIQLNTHVVSTNPLQRDDDAAFLGFYTKPKGDGKDRAGWYRSKATYTAHDLNRTYEGNLCFTANVDTSSTVSNIKQPVGYEMLEHSLAPNSAFSTGTSVKDIADEELLYLHVSSDSGGTRSEYFIGSLTMELQNGHIVHYKFVRSNEVDTMISTTTLPGTATEFPVDIVSPPYAETVTVEIEKIITQPNGDTFSAPKTTLEFDVPSIDQSQVVTDVKRGSNADVVKTSFNAPSVVEPALEYKTEGVSLFSAPNYTNMSGFETLTLQPGSYDDGYLATKGFNDNIGSIKIPRGCAVTGYIDNFWGASTTYTSDQATVMSSISSLIITRTGDMGVTPSVVLTEVKLVDNANPVNENPEATGVTALTCTNESGLIQAYDATNTYSGARVAKGNVLNLTQRIQAGVKYIQTQEGSNPVENTSVGTYLSLVGAEKTYRCANKCQVAIKNHRTQVGGTYNGRTVLEVAMDTGGMGNEGIQSLAFCIGQPGSHTDENDNTGGDGIQVFLGFSATDAVTPRYALQADASLNSSDKIRPGESVDLVASNLDGLNEGALSGWKLVSGNHTDSDVSSLYFPTNSGFDVALPMSVFVACSTRVSTDIDMKETDGTSEAVLGIYKSTNFADDGKMVVEFSVEGDRDPINNTAIAFLVGGTGGSSTPEPLTKKTGTKNIYIATIQTRFISPTASRVDQLNVQDRSSSPKTFSLAKYMNFGPDVAIEVVLGIAKSVNFTTDRMIRVHFSVADNRNPIGNTSVSMSDDEGNNNVTMTVLNVAKIPDKINTYYAIVRNDGGLNFTRYNRAKLTTIYNASTTTQYSSASGLGLGSGISFNY